jgi:3',5'-cyclic-AMP phosphodiesterase
MPKTSHVIIQLSDIHLSAQGTIAHGAPGVRPRDNLLRALSLLADTGIRPDIFLLTGDLADTGDPACYDDLAGVMTDAAAEMGGIVVYVPGNHDDRATFRRHLLQEPPESSPINQLRWRNGLRIVALDSTVPGKGWGALDEATMGFLETSLASTAPAGTVLALHHPPVQSPIEEMARVSLQDPGRLANAIASSDVKIVLCGHYHHETVGMLGPIPVWVSPATAYRADVTSSTLRGLAGSAISRIDLAGIAPTVTVIHIPNS